MIMLSVGGSACHVGTPKTVSVCIYSNLLEEGMRLMYMYVRMCVSTGQVLWERQILPACVGR